MIAAIKKRDREADLLSRQLMQAGKLAAIGQLSAGVAHEINNPLAIVLTERQLLLDAAARHSIESSEFEIQFQTSMNQIDVQVQRCKRITQNLLRFSRRTESILESVDVNHFIKEVIELMEREARAGGIKFSAELDPALAPIISDPSQLQQVFLNIITNAIDAHDDKPYGSIRIKTRASAAKRGVEIEISDSGSGIAPENLEKIFDPFFTTKPVGKGTGLGLSICYSIMKQLGGDIAVHSEVGKGSEFTLFIPDNPPRHLRENMVHTNEGQLAAMPI